MNEQHVDMMKLEMQDVLENNILPFWLEKMQDNENGGFYGRIDGNNQLHPDAEKEGPFLMQEYYGASQPPTECYRRRNISKLPHGRKIT